MSRTVKIERSTAGDAQKGPARDLPMPAYDYQPSKPGSYAVREDDGKVKQSSLGPHSLQNLRFA
ncbi:hypothetical protein GCM10011335_26610 [Aureimonas glaciei]|uniref:Uncharacterized protein n=1 Tax=Aureimonas glaciei TaxID=1776957 RepID=A0A917DBL8_9HYPH|nr:hypothetical protein GCM10011335_26610 [Aureimonas glaciei]